MKIIYSLFIVILLVSCKGSTEAPVKVAPSHQKSHEGNTSSSDLNQTSSNSEVTFSEQKYEMLYNAYLNVKAALVNTDATVAQNEAEALDKLLGIIKVSDNIKEAVKVITVETDVKKQRVAFETVSQELEEVFSKELTSGTIYKQYCPMAFNGKGAYWLSDSKEIRNPYFGDQMLKCGLVEEKIE